MSPTTNRQRTTEPRRLRSVPFAILPVLFFVSCTLIWTPLIAAESEPCTPASRIVACSATPNVFLARAESKPLADRRSDGVPADAVLVSITHDRYGLVQMIYRPSNSQYGLRSSSKQDNGSQAEGSPPDCDPSSPITCGRCIYTGYYLTTYAPCGSCSFTSCGSGQAGETQRHDCWSCNPSSWNWCNESETVGWSCEEQVCCQ